MVLKMHCIAQSHLTSSSNTVAWSCNVFIRNVGHKQLLVLNQRLAFLKELEYGSGNLHVVWVLVWMPLTQKGPELLVAGFRWLTFQLHQPLQGVRLRLLNLWVARRFALSCSRSCSARRVAGSLLAAARRDAPGAAAAAAPFLSPPTLLPLLPASAPTSRAIAYMLPAKLLPFHLGAIISAFDISGSGIPAFVAFVAFHKIAFTTFAHPISGTILHAAISQSDFAKPFAPE